MMRTGVLKYFAVYKPYGMLSQFSPRGDAPTLAGLGDFPRDVYPVGRLDADSEGLLLLTNDRELNHRLLDPKFRHRRTYLVQVDGLVTREAVDILSRGVSITLDGRLYRTRPSLARMLDKEPQLPARVPPIRYRKTVPTSWIELTLREGKNRQVRRMTAAAGFPTLRLVRVAIEKVTLGNMRPGEMREYDGGAIRALLFG